MFPAFKSIFSLICTLLLLGACASNEQNEKVAYSHFKLGVTLLSKGEKAKALEQLLTAKNLDPKNPLILNHLGLTYFFMKEYEHSIIELKAALEADPKYSEAHNNLGRVYLETKNFSGARKHLNSAASDLTYANKDKVWINLGLSYFLQNRYQQSEAYFLKSISMNRKNCLAYNYYGRSLVEQEQFEKASKVLDQAIFHCKKKGFDEPHYYSAISFFRMGYKQKAIARLQEGRKLYPTGPNRQKMDEMINLMKLTTTN